MKPHLLLFYVLLLIASERATAQTPILIKDIYPGTDRGIASDNLAKRANALMNGILYFAADNSTHGLELWRSDGTEAGTYMVKDILPGSRSASSDPQDFFVHKGILYFLANDGVNGYELWKSDGTEAGTTLLKDMVSGARGSDISHYAVINDEVQFWNSYTGELWKTNGTATGTIKLVNLQGLGGFDNPVARSAVVVKGVWYFEATDDKGRELWRCDGTQAGMRRLKDINPFGNSFPGELTNVNDVLYFRADDGVYGQELWKSDGTEAGTVLVRDITPGGNGTSVTLFASTNVLFFQKYTESGGFYRSELWKSDGTAAGTVVVHNPGKSFLYGLYQATTIGNTFFYCFDEEVYRTDISKGGFQRVMYPRLSQPGTTNTSEARLNISFGLFTGIDNELHFLTQDQSPFYTGLGSLYQINKVSGADTVAQAVSSPSGYRISALLNRNNRTFFFLANHPQAGVELHRVDVCAHTAKINAPNGASFCPGSSVNIMAEGTGTTGGYTYNWKQGTSNAGTNATLAVNKAGTYTVEVTDSKGCVVSTSVEITQTTNLPVTIAGASAFCAGQANPLSATATGGSGAYTYQWRLSGNSVPGAISSTLSATVGGTYSVSVVDTKGCTGTSTNIVVTQKPSPAASVTTTTGSTTYLTGNTVTLSTPTATGQTYQWLKDNQPISGATNNTYVANLPGSYAVTVTRDGCSATSTATVVNLITALEPGASGIGMEISPNPALDVCRVKLTLETTAPAEVQLLDMGGKSIRYWSSGKASRTHETTFSLTDLPAGLYLVQATANNRRAVAKLIKN